MNGENEKESTPTEGQISPPSFEYGFNCSYKVKSGTNCSIGGSLVGPGERLKTLTGTWWQIEHRPVEKDGGPSSNELQVRSSRMFKCRRNGREPT